MMPVLCKSEESSGQKRRRKMAVKKFRLLLLLCICVLLGSMNAQAAKKKGWVRNSKKQWFYYRDGKALKGMQTIGKKTYYFSKKGVQRTSWRKIGKDYYYFKPAVGSKGYMLKNKKKNGIRLDADGKALLTSTRAQKKAAVMARASKFLDTIVTSGHSKQEKLKTCFDYLRYNIPYRFTSHFRKKDPNWDIWSANALMDNGYADCHPYACTFAYLANAIGYDKVYIQTAKKHSWVRIGSRYYDVSISVRFFKNSYFLYGKKKKPFMKYQEKHGYPLKLQVSLRKL